MKKEVEKWLSSAFLSSFISPSLFTLCIFSLSILFPLSSVPSFLPLLPSSFLLPTYPLLFLSSSLFPAWSPSIPFHSIPSLSIYPLSYLTFPSFPNYLHLTYQIPKLLATLTKVAARPIFQTMVSLPGGN